MLLSILQLVIWTLILLIFARVLLSWVYPRRDVEWIDRLYQVTDYILSPIQRVVPPFNGLDFSPMIALLVLTLLSSVLR